MALGSIPVPVAWLEPESIIPGHFGQHMPGTFCECGIDDEETGFSYMCNQPPLWLLVSVENPSTTVFVCPVHAYLYWENTGGEGMKEWEWVNILAWSVN